MVHLFLFYCNCLVKTYSIYQTVFINVFAVVMFDIPSYFTYKYLNEINTIYSQKLGAGLACFTKYKQYSYLLRLRSRVEKPYNIRDIPSKSVLTDQHVENNGAERHTKLSYATSA